MSRSQVIDSNVEDGFPRVSGDEPGGDGEADALCEFSPRERG